MTEPADAEHANKVTRSGAAVAERVERRDAGAEQRRAFDRRQIFRHMRQGLSRCGHVFRVTAIVGNSSREQSYLAGEEITAPAVVAIAAMSTVPADAYSLSSCPSRD